ncbi:MAG: hypothetical protein ABIH37_03750 [archaeon]
MTTEFYTKVEYLDKKRISKELEILISRETIEIGTCRGNSNRDRDLLFLKQEQHGEWPSGLPYQVTPSIEELTSSGEPYYSKWDNENPIEFFNTALRFCWNIPIAVQEISAEEVSAEEFQRRMVNFWDSILRDKTPVYHGSHYPIDTWQDLRKAIFGDERYMEPSRYVQGTSLSCLIHPDE